MKNILFIYIFFKLFPLHSQDSNIVNTIIYNIGNYTTYSNDESKKVAFEKIKLNQDKIQFELRYNKFRSVCNQIQKLEEQDNIDYKIASVVNRGTIINYKNLITKEKIYQAELQGQIFNIVVPFNQYVWEIMSESKIIGGFKCYKAKTTFEKRDESRRISKTFNPVVWFTPDIPSSFGPCGLDGLPGLVLEATIDGNKYFYATKILLNQEKNSPIEKPKNGKNLTEKEFEVFNATIYNEIKRNKS